LLSDPIATGEFTLNIPSSKIPRLSVLPIRKPGLKATADTLKVAEKAVFELLQKSSEWGNRHPKAETPLYVSIQSDPYDSEFEFFKAGFDGYGNVMFQKESVCKAHETLCVFKRLAKDGWKKDSVVVFNLAAYGKVQRGPPSTIPPISGLGVGYHYNMDIEMLSEADLDFKM